MAPPSRESKARVRGESLENINLSTVTDVGSEWKRPLSQAGAGVPPPLLKSERDGCFFIRLLAEDLDFPTTCTCSALALYHSYKNAQKNPELHTGDTGGKSLFTSSSERAKSPVDWAKVEAGACVLVATKANEVQRKVRDVVNVVYQRARPESLPLEVGNVFWDLRDALVAAEQDVLRSLGFSIQPELPFVYLLNYLKALSPPANVAAAAHALLLESFDLPLCLAHSPQALAAATLHLAALFFDHTLPAAPPPSSARWNQVISVSDEEMERIGSQILDLLEPSAAAFAARPDAEAQAEEESRKLRLWLRAH